MPGNLSTDASGSLLTLARTSFATRRRYDACHPTARRAQARGGSGGRGRRAERPEWVARTVCATRLASVYMHVLRATSLNTVCAFYGRLSDFHLEVERDSIPPVNAQREGGTSELWRRGRGSVGHTGVRLAAPTLATPARASERTGNIMPCNVQGTETCLLSVRELLRVGGNRAEVVVSDRPSQHAGVRRKGLDTGVRMRCKKGTRTTRKDRRTGALEESGDAGGGGSSLASTRYTLPGSYHSQSSCICVASYRTIEYLGHGIVRIAFDHILLRLSYPTCCTEGLRRIVKTIFKRCFCSRPAC